jgi:sodium transport system permease protein
MSTFIKDLWLVAQRELRHYFRDPHVLIYSVLLPALLYPTTVILMIEGSLWQESLAEKRGIRVSMPAPLVAKDFEVALRKASYIKIVNSSDPVKALQNAEVDAVIRTGSDGTVEILTPPKSDAEALSPHSKLELLVDDFKRESLKGLLETKGYKPEQLGAFLLKQSNVSNVATSLTTIVPYVCCLALMMMSLGAIYPAIAAFTEEREKKTLESTLTLPIDRVVLVLGKLGATSFVTLLASVLNLLCILSVVALMGSLPQAQVLQLQRGPWFTAPQLFVVTLVFLLNAVEVSALFLLLSQFARTVREAQNLLTLPSLILSLLSITAMSPFMVLTLPNSLLPLLNAYIVCKSIYSNNVPWNLCAISFLVNLIVTVVLIVVLSKFVEQEQFGLSSTSFRKLFKVSKAKS